MKIFCFIVSIWVVTLSTLSCCGDDTCDDSSIITEQSSHDEDSCSNCSPLLACGACGGFVFQLTSFSFQPVPIESKNSITPWTERATLNCPIEIWQPPKLV